jgi:membrane fusion protein (multidrug efflux system)
MEEYDTALAELNVQDAEIELMRAQSPRQRFARRSNGIVGLRLRERWRFHHGRHAGGDPAAARSTQDRFFHCPRNMPDASGPSSPLSFSVAGGERRFKAEIYAQDPRIDAATRTVLLRAWCENPGGRLLPGASASVRAGHGRTRRSHPGALGGGPSWTQRAQRIRRRERPQGRAARREAGTRLESTVHIVSGLHKGDVIITSGLQQMRPGQLVRSEAE